MIAWKDLINLEDDESITKAIEVLKQFNKVITVTTKSAQDLKNNSNEGIKAIVRTAEDLEKASSKLNATTKEGRTSITKNAKAAEILAKNYEVVRKSAGDYDKYLKDLGKTQNQVAGTTKKLDSINKQHQKTREQLNATEVKAIENAKKQAQSNTTLAATEKVVNEEQKKLNVTGELLGKTFKKNQQIREQLNAQETFSMKQQTKLNIQLQERKKLLKQQAMEELGLIDAYQKESQTLNALRKTYKAVATEYGVNSKQAKALIGEVTRLDVKLKEVDKSAGQNQRSVGAYGNAMQSLTPIMGSFGGRLGLITSQLGSIKTALSGFATAQKASAAATGASSNALKMFRIALISTGIGAIVVALGALIAAFASTQAGADSIAKSLAPIKGAFQGIIGVAQQLALNIFPLISEKFSAMITNQLLGINKFRAAWNKLTGDTEEYEELQKKIASQTSERDASLKKSEEYINNIKKAWNGAGDSISAAMDAQIKFTNMQIELEKAQIRAIVPLAKMKDEFQKLKEIGQDQMVFDEERIAALDKAEKIQRKISGTENDLLAQEIKILELKQSQIDTGREGNEGQRELEEMKAKFFDNEKRAQREINTIVSLRSGIEKRMAIERKKALDEEAKRLAEIEGTRLKSIEEINRRILQSSEDLVQARIEEEIRLRDFEIKFGDEKLQSLEERIALEISLERRKSSELIKLKDQELKDLESKRKEDLQKSRDLVNLKLEDERVTAKEKQRLVEVQKIEEAAINKKYDDIISQTKEAQKVELVKIQEDLENEVSKITQEGSQERLEIIKKERAQRIAEVEMMVSAISDFGSQVSDLAEAIKERRDLEDEKRIEKLTEQRDEELALFGENEEAKAQLEKRFDEKKAAIEKEQAKRARKLAIFQKTLSISEAIVNTGLGVTKALGQAGIFGIPLAAIIGAMGALQVATIVAQPLPAYAKGTDNAKGGLSIVGEVGREIVREPSGKTYLTGDSAELRDIPQGSQVLTNAITENILAGNVAEDYGVDAEKVRKGVKSEKQSLYNNGLKEAVNRSSDNIVGGFKEALGGVEIHQWRMGSKGIRRDVRKGNTIYKDVEEENKF